MKVLITDQMFGPSPYNVINELKLTFDQLLEAVKEMPTPPQYCQKPEVQEVDENAPMTLRWCTTVWRANPETGMAEVWKSKWDTSG